MSLDINNETYYNEGFMYINIKSNETFIKGEIRTIENKIICPGEIVSIVNPISELNKEFDFEKNIVFTNEKCLENIKYYTPLIRGTKIRIYWDNNCKKYNISTEGCIYTHFNDYENNSYFFNKHNINNDLLDKNKCYYCILERDLNKLYLRYITDIKKPILSLPIMINDDLAFENHIELYEFNHTYFEKEKIYHMYHMYNKMDKSNSIDDNYYKNIKNNGILCFMEDGMQIEYRTFKYNTICSIEKPDYLSPHLYYIYFLNKYADGETLILFFNNLYDDIEYYLIEFPEHKTIFNEMNYKLQAYMNNKSNYIDTNYKDSNYKNSDGNEDKINDINNINDIDKINLIKKLLKKHPENILIDLEHNNNNNDNDNNNNKYQRNTSI